MDETKIIEFLGISFPLNTLIAYAVLLAVVIIGLVYLNRRLSVSNPSRLQVAVEWLIEFIEGIVRDNIGASYKQPYVILSLGVFIFLIISNFMGLPFFVHVGHYSYFKSPTADPVVTLTLAVVMNLISHYFGIKDYGGFGPYMKASYGSPNFAMLPIKLIEEIINIFTLALRLFGNIFAGEVLLKLIAQFGNLYGVATWIPGIPLQMVWQVFSLFIGAIQAYIFVTLSNVYLSHKVQGHE
ncbi:F0F1 ATP synthase subunit A [Hutsoniella sourekii]